MRRTEWWMVIVGLLVIAVIILYANGIYVVERAVTTTRVDQVGQNRDHQPYIYRDENLETITDEVLYDIAREFGDARTQSRSSTRRQLQQQGLDPDEAAYVEKVKTERNSSIDGAKEWYSVLKRSKRTYDTVKNIFDYADDGQRDGSVNAQDMTRIFTNSGASEMVYEQLRKNFNIPESESKAFARRGNHELNEWADFVEEQQQR